MTDGDKDQCCKAVFFDRDGTLIEDRGYICDFSQVVIFPFAVETVRRMNELGFKVIIITNQSSIARGICTEEQVNSLHRELTEYFKKQGAVIDHIYYCPYHADGVIERFKIKHENRKPSPGMILEAVRQYGIDLSLSYVMGDSACDMGAAKNAGCKGILVLTGKDPQGSRLELKQNQIIPHMVVDNILTAAWKISQAE